MPSEKNMSIDNYFLTYFKINKINPCSSTARKVLPKIENKK
jgi:hypothetical protein